MRPSRKPGRFRAIRKLTGIDASGCREQRVGRQNCPPFKVAWVENLAHPSQRR